MKDSSKAGFGLLADSVLDAASNIGSELAKESVSHIAGEIAIDSVSSFLPDIGGPCRRIKRFEQKKT